LTKPVAVLSQVGELAVPSPPLGVGLLKNAINEVGDLIEDAVVGGRG
jgi:hypothetical protein